MLQKTSYLLIIPSIFKRGTRKSAPQGVQKENSPTEGGGCGEHSPTHLHQCFFRLETLKVSCDIAHEECMGKNIRKEGGEGKKYNSKQEDERKRPSYQKRDKLLLALLLVRGGIPLTFKQ
eukprot:TRINITY_DN15796_c1_g1_i1.p2 TRINITY_DN15796_c1_g1~~TRINITY_DN15796_c1_g1_i1.p2  ORF type:complete len:120 (-),score=5.16 TRINITY_DN15796_c1_g1_i1:715-1074(-)